MHNKQIWIKEELPTWYLNRWRIQQGSVLIRLQCQFCYKFLSCRVKCPSWLQPNCQHCGKDLKK